jgi:hypothetical protein
MRYSLAILVVLPARLRRFDVPILPLLGAPAEQNDDLVSILAEVHAIARAEVDLQLKDTGADALHIGRIACFQPR